MPAKPKNMTTIAISKKNAKKIVDMEHGSEDYDAVVTRLLNNQADVNFELIIVDNELPQLHTLVFQLGDDPESQWFFNGATCVPITLAESNKLLKQPKPNMTINAEEAIALLGAFHVITEFARGDRPLDKQETALRKKLSDFLENQPK